MKKLILNTAKKIASKELGLSKKDRIVITGGDVWTPIVRENDRICDFFYKIIYKGVSCLYDVMRPVCVFMFQIVCHCFYFKISIFIKNILTNKKKRCIIIS